MRWISVQESYTYPEGVALTLNKRKVTVKGPRGEISRAFPNLYEFSHDKSKRKLTCKVWFASNDDAAICKTLISHIKNMVTGVTKGFQYKMRFAYAHFPVNVTVEGQTVEIRNFLGEKAVRRINIPEGIACSRTDQAKQKDELVLVGNDLELVSQTAANIHQSCLVKNKDIRKFLDGIYVSQAGPIPEE